jgi:hypothetical protein
MIIKTYLKPQQILGEFTVVALVIKKASNHSYTIDAECIEGTSFGERVTIPHAYIEANLKTTLQEQKINLKHNYSIGDKLYRRYADSIVSGVVTGLYYTGDMVDYLINFADGISQEEFCHEATLTIDKTKVELPEDEYTDNDNNEWE